MILKLWYFFVFLEVCFASKEEERLLKDLFTGEFTNAARPIADHNDAVEVQLGMSLYQIVDIHEKSQTLQISAFIRQIWSTDVYTWNPGNYSNIIEINVDPQKIWRPDLVLYNNADDDKTFGGNLERLNTRATLNNTGHVKWLAPIILKSQCSIDVTYFPFDTQKCHLKFGSWTYNQESLNLTCQTESVDLSQFSPNSAWHLESATCKLNVRNYTCCPGKFPDTSIYFVLARRSLFYLCNLIFPMTVIGMLTILSFLLPAESGERVSLAITLLLAMTVFMLVVADIIPVTSDVVPLVGVFFSASMIEMVIMIVVLCYVMRLYNKEEGDPPMAPWMKRYIYNRLSFIVYIRKQEDNQNIGDDNNYNLARNRHQQQQQQQQRWQHLPQQQHRMRWSKDNNDTSELMLLNRSRQHEEFNINIFDKTKQQSKENCNRNLLFPPSTSNLMRYEDANKCNHISTESRMILDKLSVLIDKLTDNDEADRIKQEWRTVAMTIDRCLVLFFSLVYAITLIGCFSIAPGYVP